MPGLLKPNWLPGYVIRSRSYPNMKAGNGGWIWWNLARFAKLSVWVMNAPRAVVEVENYLYATSQLAQTTLRSVLGQVDLDDLLSRRETLNVKLQAILDQHTDAWGIKVSLVEVKQVDLPQEMQRAMAKQAEAEREKRAKIIHADGECQAAAKLAEAAGIISKEPVALQLRYLQTLTEIGVEKNTTVVFPVPIDILKNWMRSST